MAAPTAWPIQFASGAKLGVKRKISKRKKERNTKKTSVLHGHSISNGRKVGTGWYLISAVVSLCFQITKASFCVYIYFCLGGGGGGGGGILFLKEVRILIFCILRRHRICIFCPILMFFSL